MSDHSALLQPAPARATVGALGTLQYTTRKLPTRLAELHSFEPFSTSVTTFGSESNSLTQPVTFGTDGEHRSQSASHIKNQSSFSAGFSADFLPNRLDTPAPVRPIAFLGHSFEVHELAGARTVLRKGRQRYCWHVAKGRVAEIVLAGIDLQVVRS